MKDKLPIQSESQFLVYQTEDGKLKIDVRFDRFHPSPPGADFALSGSLMIIRIPKL